MATHKFKKGDKVRCLVHNYNYCDYNQVYTVHSHDGTGDMQFEEIMSQQHAYEEKDFKLVKAADLGELIGYKMLKDLPDLKAGEIFKKDLSRDTDFPWISKTTTKNRDWSFTEEQILQADWFEPVYEPANKVLETVNGKKYEVDKKRKQLHLLDISGNKAETITFAVAKKFAANFRRMYTSVIAGPSIYTISFVHFRIKFGCVEMSTDDIVALEKAITE